MKPTSVHDSIVERLVADAKPVRRLWPPRRRFLVWLGMPLALLVALAWLGLRPDLAQRLASPLYVLELLAVLAAALGAAALGLRSAVPGRTPTRGEIVALVLLLAVAAILVWRQPLNLEVAVSQFALGRACAARTLALAVAPFLLLVVAIRRGLPLQGSTSAALAGAGALGAAFVLMRLFCPMDELLHLAVWHALPVIAGVGLAAVLGRRVLRG